MKKALPLHFAQACLLVCIFLFTACANESFAYKTVKPSDEDVAGFIKTHALNVVGRKNTEAFTILLFENDFEAGHYLLFRGRDNALYDACCKAVYADSEKVLLGGVATQTPFVTAIIRDPEILSNADTARVVFDDGTEVVDVLTDRGFVLVYPQKVDKPINLLGFEIRDAAGKVTYEK